VSSDFFNLLERLVIGGVDFVVVGGFAGVVHGCSYVTEDIDICCDFTADNLLTLQEALADIHPVHRQAAGRKKLELTKENCSQYKNLYLDTDIGQLDCLGFIDGLGDYRQVRKVSDVFRVGDMEIHVLNLDALITARKAMNRPRDKEAILQLQTIKKLRKNMT
jgi:hypothetical protein